MNQRGRNGRRDVHRMQGAETDGLSRERKPAELKQGGHCTFETGSTGSASSRKGTPGRQENRTQVTKIHGRVKANWQCCASASTMAEEQQIYFGRALLTPGRQAENGKLTGQRRCREGR